MARVAANTVVRTYRQRNLPDAPIDVGVNPNGDPIGMARRVLYVEADDIIGAFSPGSDTDEVASRAQIELDAHKQLFLLTATVSETAIPKFKQNTGQAWYDIGDLVTVIGEFGLPQVMRVIEHMLTSDRTGTRGYPSLSVYDSSIPSGPAD